ncbi:alpha/beta hydrolase [Sphingomonas psychrotolerans]|uniref:Alpha/beta hydrolase n=1 Tax=Sphingomonas psychrotolerans TaxID=1327635 RepID=A0ABU3N9X6_9SPHN|nr:alpha/beta hydrolase [Sphingomonas psychrotolerans]MDT8760190.1 alpha/beta hydrolase [Sphingomonas psychrotolerans]
MRAIDEPELAAGLAAYLAIVRRQGSPPPLETSRLQADRDAHRIAYPRPAGMRVVNTHAVGGGQETPVRIYRPAGDEVQPAIVYLHGGGFTAGSIESYDGLATALAEASGASVISVQYARLPEATPRAVLAQCCSVLDWVVRMAEVLRIDAARLAVAGDSAGAFLATHLAIAARDARGPLLVCQLLAYGVYALEAAAGDPGLPATAIEAMIATYRECSARDATPLPAPAQVGDLAGLPPAILLTGEYDALRAEGLDHASRLRAAGVPVTERIASAMCHGFLRAVAFSEAARAEMRWLGAICRNHLQPRTD